MIHATLDLLTVPIDSVQPHPTNPRRGVIPAIAESLRVNGQYRPIVVNRRDGFILGGNHTWRAAKELGWESIAVTWVDVDDEAAARILLVDNRTNDMATWDDLGLLAVIESLNSLEGTGYSDEALDELRAECERMRLEESEIPEDPGPDLDHAEELREKWGTELGQLWEIPSETALGHSHRLLCGDSTDPAVVARLMNGERAALFATDPPYLVDYDGTNHPHKWNGHDANKDWSESYHDWDQAAQGDGLYDGFVSVAVETAIRENAAWYCWHASRRQAMLEEVWERHSAFVHQQIIWVKDRPILTRSWYMWQHEPCFFGWVRGRKPMRRADDHPASVWVLPTVGPGQATDHPTSKPVEVFAIPMRQHTNPGEICYEPFSGSGSQHVAGEQTGRLVYGLELQPVYVAVILERLSGMGLEPRLLEESE